MFLYQGVHGYIFGLYQGTFWVCTIRMFHHGVEIKNVPRCKQLVLHENMLLYDVGLTSYILVVHVISRVL